MCDLINARVDPSTGLLGSAGNVPVPNGPSKGMFNPQQFAKALEGGGEGAAAEAGGLESLAVLAL